MKTSNLSLGPTSDPGDDSGSIIDTLIHELAHCDESEHDKAFEQRRIELKTFYLKQRRFQGRGRTAAAAAAPSTYNMFRTIVQQLPQSDHANHDCSHYKCFGAASVAVPTFKRDPDSSGKDAAKLYTTPIGGRTVGGSRLTSAGASGAGAFKPPPPTVPTSGGRTARPKRQGKRASTPPSGRAAKKRNNAQSSLLFETGGAARAGGTAPKVSSGRTCRTGVRGGANKKPMLRDRQKENRKAIAATAHRRQAPPLPPSLPEEEEAAGFGCTLM